MIPSCPTYFPSFLIKVVCSHLACCELAVAVDVREHPEATAQAPCRLRFAVEREVAVLVHLLLDGGDESLAFYVLFVDLLSFSKARIVAHRCNLQGA